VVSQLTGSRGHKLTGDLNAKVFVVGQKWCCASGRAQSTTAIKPRIRVNSNLRRILRGKDLRRNRSIDGKQTEGKERLARESSLFGLGPEGG